MPTRFVFHSLLVALLFLTVRAAYAAFDVTPQSIPALGNGDLAGLQSNPAAARLLNPAAGAVCKSTAFYAHILRQWDLKELDQVHLQTLIRVNNILYSMGVRTTGSQLYRESMSTVSASSLLLSNISLGLAFQYGRVELTDFPSSSIVSSQLGVEYRRDKWVVAFAADHVGKVSWGDAELHCDPKIRGGFRYAFLEDLYIFGSGEFVEYRTPAISAGAVAEISEFLYFRAGYTSASKVIQFGFSILFSQASMDMAFQNHSTLGWTKGMAATWSPDD